MKNETLYKELKNIYEDLEMLNPKEDRYILQGCMSALKILMQNVENDIYTSQARRDGKTQQVKAAKRVIKIMEKIRPQEAGAYFREEHGEKLQYVGNPYLAVRLHKHLPLVEMDESKEHFPFDSIIEQSRKNSDEELKLPIADSLEKDIKLGKLELNTDKQPIFNFGEHFPTVNAKYLLDVLTLLGDCTASVKRNNSKYGVIYFFNKDGDEGVLCPIRA